MKNRFEEIKKNTPELIMFLKAFPKGADLHTHSLGASYSEFIYEDAVKHNDYYDLRNNMFLTKEEYSLSDKDKNIIPIEIFKKYYADNMFNSYSMRGWDGIHGGAEHFFSTFPRALSSKRDENNMILEMAERNINQNVKYLEIISECIPHSTTDDFRNILSKEKFDISQMKRYCEILDNLDTEENYQKVKIFLDKREIFLKEKLNKDFCIKYIPFMCRASSALIDFTAEAYMLMLYCIKDTRIAAVNLVEPEDNIFSRENFGTQMEIIRFIHRYLSEKYSASYKKINLTLHAGELNLLRSPLEDMNDRICSTIFLTRNKNEQKFPAVKRIGHGVSIPWEDNADTLLRFMSINKIAVEICLTSNEIILGVKGKEHPFSLYKKYNVPMIICTDDEAVSRTNITKEYLKAVKNFNLTYDDLKNLSRNGIEYSFLEGEGLFVDGDYENMREEFKNISSLEEWKERFAEYKEFIMQNEKLKRQIELEISFLIFEQNYL